MAFYILQVTRDLKLSIDSILEDLTPYDVRQLVMMEDEMAETKARLQCIKYIILNHVSRIHTVNQMKTFPCNRVESIPIIAGL